MIPEIRDGLLSVEGAIDDSQVEFYDDDTMNLPVNYYLNNNDQQNDDNKIRKDYNVGVIKHLQGILISRIILKFLIYPFNMFSSFHFRFVWTPNIEQIAILYAQRLLVSFQIVGRTN